MTKTVELNIPHSAEERAKITEIILEQQVEALSLKVEDLKHEIERLLAALIAIAEYAEARGPASFPVMHRMARAALNPKE